MITQPLPTLVVGILLGFCSVSCQSPKDISRSRINHAAMDVTNSLSGEPQAVLAPFVGTSGTKGSACSVCAK